MQPAIGQVVDAHKNQDDARTQKLQRGAARRLLPKRDAAAVEVNDSLGAWQRAQAARESYRQLIAISRIFPAKARRYAPFLDAFDSAARRCEPTSMDGSAEWPTSHEAAAGAGR